MDAIVYLKSRGFKVKKLKGQTVGQFSVEHEFSSDTLKGIVVVPKFIRMPDDAYSVFSDMDIDYVVNKGLYGIYRRDSGSFVRVRAIEPDGEKHFPDDEVFDGMVSPVRMHNGEAKGTLLINTVKARLADEKANNLQDWDNTIAGTADECSKLLNRIIGDLQVDESLIENILKNCAIFAGFRLTPKSKFETALLMDWLVGSFMRNPFHRLPKRASHIVNTIADCFDSVTVISNSVNFGFAALDDSEDNYALIDGETGGASEILGLFRPNVRLLMESYIDCEEIPKTDAMIMFVPRIWKDLPDTQSYPFIKDLDIKRVSPEAIYIAKAVNDCKENGLLAVVVNDGLLSSVGLKPFRSWLMDKMQVLGVISLTGENRVSRNSILLMRKTSPMPDDYSVTMMAMSAEDLEGEKLKATISSVKGVIEATFHGKSST